MADPFPNRFRCSAWMVVALLLGAGAGLSCGSSAPLSKDDGGGGLTGADAPVDHSVSASGGEGGTFVDAATDGAREQIGNIGASCSASGDCASGHCFDGVCCQEDCSTACHSCALPGSVGTCLLADVGTDPRNDCDDQGSASCGFDGTCDGSGACRKYPTGIVCKQPSCNGSTLTLAFRCAAGVCSPTSGQPCDPFMCGTTTSCSSTCTRDADCTTPNVCVNGSCGKGPLGGSCAVGDDCNSGICQQGVCCSTTCTGTCRSCALPGSGGACTNVPERQDPLDQCADSGATSCGTDGTCDGAGACRFYARGTTCRAVAGVCDVAETCAGAGAPCPADGFTSGTVCRPSAGICDAAETCSGTSAACPPDVLVPAGTVCRQLAGICDAAETCSGTSPTCPADGFAAVGTVCRTAAGVCDVSEVCSGGAAACPPDGFVANGTPCRPSAGICDVAEVCNGSAACPPDAFVAPGTVCRPAVDLCDVAESCTGGMALCPPDVLVAAGTVCRAAAGTCDVAEACNGTTPACPADGFVLGGTVCRAPVGICDVAETCSGGAPACPPDAVVAAGALVCRPAAGGCDIADSCDGVATVCPIDAVAPTPTPPTNLAATRGNNQATLTWTAVAGATSYTIARSTVSGGPYTTVGTTAATTTFVNTGLTNGTTYFFVISVTTVGPGCVSPNSAQVAVIPSACPGVYCDDFEADTVGTQANGWTRVGGSAGDWLVTSAGTKFFSQVGATSSTFRAAFSSGAPGAPWSGATSISADVELTELGLSGQAALLCVRYVDVSNFYCAALGPTGVQIQTKVNGNAVNSAIFAQSINTGSIQQMSLSLSAAGVLSVTLNSSVRGTLTPAALASGFVAVATTSVEASFDTIVVSQP